MYSGEMGPGRWWGPDLTKTKSRGSPWIAPKDLFWGWPAQNPHHGVPGKFPCTTTELCEMDAPQSQWTGILASCPWGMPAGHISSLNLPPSHTVLMKGKCIRCSFVPFDSTPCRSGIPPAKPNHEAAAQTIFNWGFIVLPQFRSLRNLFWDRLDTAGFWSSVHFWPHVLLFSDCM